MLARLLEAGRDQILTFGAYVRRPDVVSRIVR